MKPRHFFQKLFPCMYKQTEEPTNDELQNQRKFLEEQLNQDRQQRLEQQRLENERLAHEEFERIIKESEELRHQKESAERLAAIELLVAKEQEESERALAEDLQNIERAAAEAEVKRQEELRQLEDAQRAEEQNLLEQERLKEENIKNIVQDVFEEYKEKYHEFYSTRHQPIHSNFNEKMFKDLCNKFIFSTKQELLISLDEYNHMQKNNKDSYNELSTKRRLKCDVFNFYLFM